MVVDMFPQAAIMLNRELASGMHPELESMIKNSRTNNPSERLAIVATYCEVLVDGMYSEADVTNLCGVLYNKLVSRRQRNTKNDIVIH